MSKVFRVSRTSFIQYWNTCGRLVMNRLCWFFPWHFPISTWLNGDFPPAMWNVHAATTRTNNVVEGWHSRLNKAIGCCHPNVYKLVTVLKGEQALTELTIRRADTGAPPPPRRRKYRDLDTRLDRLLDQYRQGQLTTDNYLTALRHVVHHY